MRKLLLMLSISIFLLFSLTSCKKIKKYDIVATSFAGYDFVRAVAKDKMSYGYLLSPGEELHDYSPSVSDIETAVNSKVFIYVGGESDEEWVENDILPEINKNKTKVINMMDVIKNEGNVYYEEDPNEIESEEEYDEHIWTSITNAKILLNKICDVLKEIDKDNETTYTNNLNSYINDLNEVDLNIKDVINTSSKDLVIFADRFPLLYFFKEYKLKYDAAFKGCDHSKDCSPETINRLIKKIKNNNINIIFTIELSSGNIADSIKKECDVEVMTFYSMHNVSKSDFKNKLTYIDYMNKNIEALRLALN